MARYDRQGQGKGSNCVVPSPPLCVYPKSREEEQDQESRSGTSSHTSLPISALNHPLKTQVVLTMISMASYSRSHHRCKLQKLLTIYFKSCGLGAKAFDTLNALGISMSQKWAYSGIEKLSQAARDKLVNDVKTYPWFGTHDNLNLGFKVYEQRLSNQRHFDSGTAATVIIIKDPDCVPPSSRLAKEMLAHKEDNPLTYMDILKFDMRASSRLRTRAIYWLLSVLINAPEFDFDTYKQK